MVRRGALRCPRCDGRILGYVDVTVHPAIRVEDGRLVTGAITDSHARIERAARDLAGAVFEDEFYCEAGCGYRTNARVLREQGIVV